MCVRARARALTHMHVCGYNINHSKCLKKKEKKIIFDCGNCTTLQNCEHENKEQQFADFGSHSCSIHINFINYCSIM